VISAGGGLEVAIVTISLGAGSLGGIAALHARARSRADRLALRLVRGREATMVTAAQRFATAAGGSPGDVRRAFDQTARAFAPVLDAVAIFEETDGALCCVGAFGPRIAYFLGCRLALDDTDALVARSLARGHHVTRATETDARPLHPADAWALAAPLDLGRGRRGVLYAAAPGGVDAAAIEPIVESATLAAAAYRIAAERAEDRLRADYDGLTGLLTPRSFRERLGAQVERSRFDPRSRIALLFVDIDHFKEWNDTYGHASGDALLRAIAAQLRAAARDDGDLIGRNGGDEFCLAFPDMDKATAITRADDLRRAIALAGNAAPRPSDATATVAITASIGVAAAPADVTGASELLEAADAAMYASKRSGRDTVSFRTVGGALTQLARTHGTPTG